MYGLNKAKIFIITFILVLIIALSFRNLNVQNDNLEQNSEVNEKEQIIKKPKFNPKEQQIVNAIYKEIYKGNYFDSNLKSVEIESLKLFGYYKSKINELYIRVEYHSECIDGNFDCDNLAADKDSSIANNTPFYFFIVIDMNNYNILEIMDGISANINSDWVSRSGKIE